VARTAATGLATSKVDANNGTTPLNASKARNENLVIGSGSRSDSDQEKENLKDILFH
jgi:hypothetical protein